VGVGQHSPDCAVATTPIAVLREQRQRHTAVGTVPRNHLDLRSSMGFAHDHSQQQAAQREPFRFTSLRPLRPRVRLRRASMTCPGLAAKRSTVHSIFWTKSRTGTFGRSRPVWAMTTSPSTAGHSSTPEPSHLSAAAEGSSSRSVSSCQGSPVTAAWHRLRDGTEWQDLGAAHFDCADAQTADRPIRCLQQRGIRSQPRRLERERFISAASELACSNVSSARSLWSWTPAIQRGPGQEVHPMTRAASGVEPIDSTRQRFG
jgi:hypothetical protein